MIVSRRKSARSKIQKKPRPKRSGGEFTTISMASVPFPLKISNWLPYAYPYVLAGNPLYNESLNANTVYHVDGTRNVYNFGAMSTVYQRFLVDKVRLEYTVQNTTAGIGLIFVIYPTENGASALTALAAAQQKGAVVGFAAPSSGAPSSVTKTIDVDMRRFFGVQNLSTSNAIYCGDYGGYQPTVLYYLKIAVSSIDGATNVTANVFMRAWFHTTSFSAIDAAP
jgi:hypothetical protein